MKFLLLASPEVVKMTSDAASDKNFIKMTTFLFHWILRPSDPCWCVWSVVWPSQVYYRAHSRFAPNQWETSLQSNAVSHWLDTNLESALYFVWLSWLLRTAESSLDTARCNHHTSSHCIPCVCGERARNSCGNLWSPDRTKSRSV